MKKLLSIALTGAVALSAGSYFVNSVQQTSMAATYGKYQMLEYEVYGGNSIIITDCLDMAKGKIEIPEKIEKFPVISIGMHAFENNEYITSIVLPEKIETIQPCAFEGCGLETIEMQEGVGSIQGSAFCDAKNLKYIEIPESVETIYYQAFDGCISLEYIVIKNPYCDIYDNANTISDTAVIYGYENSTAQAYAEVYGREFRLIDEAPTTEETTTTTETETTTTETETTTTETETTTTETETTTTETETTTTETETTTTETETTTTETETTTTETETTTTETETTTTETETTTTETETPTTEEIESLKGDANGDNAVTIADAVAILQYLANSDEYPLSEQGAKNADVAGGGDGINTDDALLIQQFDAGVAEIG